MTRPKCKKCRRFMKLVKSYQSHAAQIWVRDYMCPECKARRSVSVS